MYFATGNALLQRTTSGGARCSGRVAIVLWFFVCAKKLQQKVCGQLKKIVTLCERVVVVQDALGVLNKTKICYKR